VRKQLPFRTLFNLVGPLANPARPEFQLVGVGGDRQAVLIASSLANLQAMRAAVVTGSDGIDEVTLGGATHVRWIEGGRVTEDVWEPEDFGLSRVTASELHVSGPSASADRIRGLLAGEPGPVRNVVLANSAAALRVAGRVETLRAGVDQAAAAIDSGAAQRLLERWRQVSNEK
jgi:anthranilate phosphoribosyltransferase